MRLVPQQSAAGTLDEYVERVAKYVPVEVILAYLAIQSGFQAGSSKVPACVEFAIYALLVIATPLYLLRLGGNAPNKGQQVAIGTISFLVWTYGIGGTFFWGALERACHTTIMYPAVAGALVTLWSLGVGLIKPSSAPAPPPVQA